MAKRDGWTPAVQRIFIAWLAHYGSPTHACVEVGKARSGIDKIYKSADADEFRASWDGAIDLFERRRVAQMASRHGGNGALRPPTPARGRGRPAPWSQPLLPGQVYNEMGWPEDESSFNRRGEEARDNIGEKLLRCRRAYLAEIARSPGKRAAFEILTELPIDWDKARRLEPQDHEPWRRPRMREPDMVLTAENGWLRSIVPYGPDKITALREAVDRHRAKQGLPPANWNQPDDGERSEDGPADDTAPRPRHSAVEIAADEPPRPDDGFRPNIVAQPDGPNMRSYDLNSREFYDRVKQPRDGTLPRQPTEWAPEPVPKVGPAPRTGPAGRRRK